MAKHTAIVTMEGEQETVPKLSNGTTFNDLQRPLTWFPRSRHCLTLNISEMAKHTAIVPEGEQETVPKLSNGTTFNDLQ